MIADHRISGNSGYWCYEVGCLKFFFQFIWKLRQREGKVKLLICASKWVVQRMVPSNICLVFRAKLYSEFSEVTWCLWKSNFSVVHCITKKSKISRCERQYFNLIKLILKIVQVFYFTICTICDFRYTRCLHLIYHVMHRICCRKEQWFTVCSLFFCFFF